MKSAFSTIFLIAAVIALGQCPVAFDFTIDPTLCQGEEVDFVNATDAESYYWDLCAGDIANGFLSASLSNNSAFGRNRTIKVIENDNQWYAFAISQTSSNLQRINLGDDLSSPAVSYTNLGTFSSGLNRPYDLDLIHDGTMWFGFVANTNNSNIVRLDFVNGIEEPPVLVDLGTFSSAIQSPQHILTIEEDGNYFVFVSDEETIVRLTLGNNLSNTPTADIFSVPGSNTLRGLSIVKECDRWVGGVLSYFSNQLFSIDFGTSLGNVPTFNALTTTNSLQFPSNIEIVNENANFYGFIQGALGKFHQLDFGNSVSDFTFSDQVLSDPVFTDNQNFALDIVNDSSKWYGFNFNLDNQQLIQFSFIDNCAASIPISTEQAPTGVSYVSAGNYNIAAKVEMVTGEIGFLSKTISVSSDIAPSALFSIDPSRCITNTNTFTPSAAGLLSYSWDFDNDNVEDSNQETPTYQFPSIGTYTVRLEVSDGTCSNFTEQEIIIYAAPPTPTFDISSDNFCEQTLFTFTNTIDETGYDDVLSYEWYLNGVLIATQKDTTYIFDTPGNKVIGLKSMLPGCESSIITQSFDIIPTPEAAFSSDTVCIGQNSIFINSSVDADSYTWDFGDGSMSTDFEPSHIYADTGTYQVKLVALDISGDCPDTLTKQVRVNRTPPTPAFVLNSPFCLGQEISLDNLTEDTSFNDEVTYQWNITDFGEFTDKAPSITFTETGDKIFELITYYRSCVSAVTSQTITVFDLPSASYSNESACETVPVFFMNESVNGDSFFWDFGDGSSSNESDPEHTFAMAGNYMVSLTTTDVNGCQDVFEEEIVVSNIPSVDFTFEIGCTTNQGVQFTDMSSVTNSDLVSWIWFVDDIEVSNEQGPSLKFSTPGLRTIRLVATSAIGCEASYEEEIDITASIQEFSYFENNQLCIDEQLDILGINSELMYQWDFCAGDIEEGFTSQTTLNNSQFARNRTIKLIQDNGSWYAFSISQTSNNLQRIDLGSDLTNIVNPSYVDLGKFNDAFNASYDLELIFDGEIWRAFVANTGAGNIIRLDFIDGIGSTPEITNLGNFSGTISEPTHILSVQDGDDFYLFVSNEESIVRVALGTSVTNESPVVAVLPVSGSNTLRGLSLVKDCDAWVGLVLSYSTNEIYSLNFSSSLDNAPLINNLGGGVSFPANVEIVNENAHYYAFVQGALGNLNRYDFGTSLSNFSYSQQALVDPIFTSNQNFALEIVNENSKWFGFNFNLDSQQLIQFSFIDNCSASISFSNQQLPKGVRFSTAGNYYVSRRVETSSGSVGYFSNSISVTAGEAPSALFSIDPSRCITNPNTFTPNLTGLASYSWDFDGDNVEDSNEESPTFQFPAVGTYTVRLDVSDGTCTNFTEQEITIYPEPPTPNFDVSPATLCLGAEVLFTNTTDETGLEGVITYSWDFGGDSDVTTKDASFTYLSPGTKTITLTASIPGCETVVEQTIEILPGPTSAFSTNVVCQEEVTTFTNSSTDAVSHHWDFGDGFESTAENPTHLYETAGSYVTTLTTTDINGCTNEFMDEVIVTDIPQVSFDFELACSSIAGVQFTDMSTVENPDLVGWSWSVDGAEVATEQNPIITFESAGVKTIRLVVQSTNGCESVYEEAVDIRDAPAPDFSFDIGCQGEISSFADIALDVGNPTTQWMWTIEGQVYDTEEVSHVFNSNGFFDVTLEITAENFCSESITKTIEVQQLPSVAFSVEGSCSNELITLSDSSADFDDQIVSRSWMIDGESIGNGEQVLIEQLNAGTYSVELAVETEAGCLVSTIQEIVINPTPIASFSSSTTYGLPGNEITFTNTSSGGSAYQWLLNDVPFSNSVNEEVITFSEVGSHKVSLITSNSFGCTDTSNVQILIAIPVVDLVIGEFELIDENGIGKIFLDIQNLSNLPVEDINVIINLEDKLPVSERITQFIDIGETERVALNVGIPLTASKPSFICVNLVSQYAGYDDKNPLNNEKCITLDPAIQIESPFPNPVKDEFRLKVVLPEGASATVRLINSVGKMEQTKSYQLDAGLNNIFIDMLGLSTGIYFVSIDVLGTVTTYRLIKF